MTVQMTEELKQEIEEMIKKGASLEEIAEKFGVSRNVMSRLIKENFGKSFRDLRKTASRTRSTDPEKEAERVILKEITNNTKNEALDLIEDIYKVGYDIYHKYRDVASTYDMSIQDFVDMCVTFFIENHKYIKEFKKREKQYKKLIKYMLPIFNERVLKLRMLNIIIDHVARLKNNKYATEKLLSKYFEIVNEMVK